VSKGRLYQIRHKAMGLCIQCSKRAVPGSPYCTKHRKYRKVVLQTQYQRRKLKAQVECSNPNPTTPPK
jgi:hypothetical protein